MPWSWRRSDAILPRIRRGGGPPKCGGGARPTLRQLRCHLPGNAGEEIDRPRADLRPTSTIVVEPGWRAERAGDGTLVLTRAVPLDRAKAIGTDVDPVRLEIFNNLFMAIAEEMGVALQSTATSVNIKERLDFSCAIFDARRRADRQCAAHPGAPRIDGREHPARSSTRAGRAGTGAGSAAATLMC